MYICYGCMADGRQFLILSERIHELDENKNDNIWTISIPGKMVSRSRPKPEAVITDFR